MESFNARYSRKENEAALPTSADIAARVNTRREAVSRELASLTRRGLIERRQKSLMIRDFAGLNQLVESMLGE